MTKNEKHAGADAAERHTKGPWRVVERDPDDCILGVQMTTGARYTVADVYGDVEEMNGAMRANAQLIAAAPEMLAVLRDLEWSRLNDGRGVTQVQCPACFALQSRGTGHNPYCGLAAALAKAESR